MSLQKIKVDLEQPLDISIPLKAGPGNVSAWYLDPISIEPVKTDQFVGDVNQGGSVNFRNIAFNPHGHGTHTECVGHISKAFYSVNETLSHYYFMAQVISVTPEMQGEDGVITQNQLQQALHGSQTEAVIIRTLPNPTSKKAHQYSSTNPPYLEEAAAQWLHDSGIKHLLIDLPSVDRELDEGKLLAHRAFWNYPDAPRLDCTITELIYVPDAVADGAYLLEFQFPPFENDASPSRPVLYKLL